MSKAMVLDLPVSDLAAAIRFQEALGGRQDMRFSDVIGKRIVDTCAEAQDHGFLYGRNCEGPDGHVFELFWRDPAAMEQM